MRSLPSLVVAFLVVAASALVGDARFVSELTCDATTCFDCTILKDPTGGCGWCSSNNACFFGDHNGPQNASNCPTADWDFYNATCPTAQPVAPTTTTTAPVPTPTTTTTTSPVPTTTTTTAPSVPPTTTTGAPLTTEAPLTTAAPTSVPGPTSIPFVPPRATAVAWPGQAGGLSRTWFRDETVGPIARDPRVRWNFTNQEWCGVNCPNEFEIKTPLVAKGVVAVGTCNRSAQSFGLAFLDASTGAMVSNVTYFQTFDVICDHEKRYKGHEWAISLDFIDEAGEYLYYHFHTGDDSNGAHICRTPVPASGNPTTGSWCTQIATYYGYQLNSEVTPAANGTIVWASSWGDNLFVLQAVSGVVVSQVPHTDPEHYFPIAYTALNDDLLLGVNRLDISPRNAGRNPVVQARKALGLAVAWNVTCPKYRTYGSTAVAEAKADKKRPAQVRSPFPGPKNEWSYAGYPLAVGPKTFLMRTMINIGFRKAGGVYRYDVINSTFANMTYRMEGIAVASAICTDGVVFYSAGRPKSWPRKDLGITAYFVENGTAVPQPNITFCVNGVFPNGTNCTGPLPYTVPAPAGFAPAFERSEDWTLVTNPLLTRDYLILAGGNTTNGGDTTGVRIWSRSTGALLTTITLKDIDRLGWPDQRPVVGMSYYGGWLYISNGNYVHAVQLILQP